MVDDVYDDLRAAYGGCKQITVLVDSGGGDIDAAYNLAQLFRRYGSEQLTFIVPRWAKSAATLLVCAGDFIEMTPVAELGPLDPQITQMNPMEQRFESFSPLHIESTLSLIREEYKNGSEALANGLLQRLQFPLTLGSFKKSLDLGKQYLIRLLSTRMLAANPQNADDVAKQITEGYADHGCCISLNEAQNIGLVVREVPDAQIEHVWKIHKLTRKKQEMEREQRQKEMMKRLKEIPPELLDKLPPGLMGDSAGPVNHPS
jgi:hypothetical protein